MRIIKKRSSNKTKNNNNQADGSTAEISGYEFVDLISNPNSNSNRNNSTNQRDLTQVSLVIESSAVESFEAENSSNSRNSRKTKQDERQKALARGIHLLSMREHSVYELTDKLIKKGFDAAVVDSVLQELLEANYVNDERFAESYVRSRQMRGMGPIKIKSELRSKGVSSSIIDEHIKESDACWYDAAEALHQKKYGNKELDSYKEWTARARFLQSRGFTMDHIHSTVPQFEQY